MVDDSSHGGHEPSALSASNSKHVNSTMQTINQHPEQVPTNGTNHTRHYWLGIDDDDKTAIGATASIDRSTLNDLNHTTQNHGRPLWGLFPNSKESLFHTPLISQDKFKWSQAEQGHILGAFFYGYIIFQIPGARMAELVGARWILMVATAGSALISFIFPLSTQLNSVYLLMVLRFIMGLCQSAFFPAAYVFFCRWLPERERSVLLPIMLIGGNVGSISSYSMSSYLISASYGWPSVFYASGFINLFVTILWIVFGSNSPRDNWLITEQECNFIQASMATQNGIEGCNKLAATSSSVADNRNKTTAKPTTTTTATTINLNTFSKQQQQNPGQSDKLLLRTHISRGQQHLSHPLAKSKSANDLLPAIAAGAAPATKTALDFNNNNKRSSLMKVQDEELPGALHQEESQLSWLKLIKSIPIWTLVLSMYGNEWSHAVLTYELPTYLKKALDFPMGANGVINSFFQLSYTIASPIMSALGAYMLDGHLVQMRKIHVRKLFQSLATFGQLACFVSVPICGANRDLIIMFMFSAVVFKACANAGDIMVSGDLSPEYAGTIYAFANSIGNTAGVLVPLLAGLIINNPNEREQWTPFWLISATIMGCSGLIFLLLGETSKQNFSIDDDKDEEKEHKKSPKRDLAVVVVEVVNK